MGVTTLKPFTVEMSVSELPESIVARFPRRPSATDRVAMTIGPAGGETEKPAALHRDLQAGIDDLDAGRARDAAPVFARLKERFAM